MKSTRKVYELAEELGRKPREVLRAAAELGIPAQNRLTRLDPESIRRLRARFHERPPDRERGSDFASS
jgi:hypothetical protein